MRLRLVSAVALAAIVATPSLAADFMHRKAGLWTVTMTLDSTKHMPGPTKMCLDANTDSRMMEHSMSWRQKDCDAPVIVGGGAMHTVDVVCHLNGGVQKTHVVMTFSGDAAYHMDMTSVSTPPVMGHGSVHMTQDAVWSGPCPADMRPGDMAMGPVKINVLDGSMGMSGGHMTKEQIEALMKAHQH